MLPRSIYFSTEHAIFYLANHLNVIMKPEYTHHWVSIEEHGAHLLEVSHVKEMKADKWSFTVNYHQNKISLHTGFFISQAMQEMGKG